MVPVILASGVSPEYVRFDNEFRRRLSNLLLFGAIRRVTSSCFFFFFLYACVIRLRVGGVIYDLLIGLESTCCNFVNSFFFQLLDRKRGITYRCERMEDTEKEFLKDLFANSTNLI